MEPNIDSFYKYLLTNLYEWRPVLDKVLHIRKHKPSITQNIDAYYRMVVGGKVGQSRKKANWCEWLYCVFGKTWYLIKPLFMLLR